MATQAAKLYEARGAIRVIRNLRVMLDADLAKLYGVPTKRLNEAVKRNIARFPSGFMFQLNQSEAAGLRAGLYEDAAACSRSQFATLNAQDSDTEQVTETPKDDAPASRGRNVKYLPYVFTEHGVVMAAMLLNSRKATEMSVFIVRAFVWMRNQLLSSAVQAKRLAEIEKTLVTHDAALVELFERIQPLLIPPPDPERKRIGFSVNEQRVSYRARPDKPRGAGKTPKGK